MINSLIFSNKLLSVFFRFLSLIYLSKISSESELLLYSTIINFLNVSVLFIGLDFIRFLAKNGSLDYSLLLVNVFNSHKKYKFVHFSFLIILVFIYSDYYILLIFLILSEYLIQEICRVLIFTRNLVRESFFQFARAFIPFLMLYFTESMQIYVEVSSVWIYLVSIIVSNFVFVFISLLFLNVIPSSNITLPSLKETYFSISITVFYKAIFFLDKLIINQSNFDGLKDYILLSSFTIFTPFVADNLYNNKIVRDIYAGNNVNFFKYFLINLIFAFLSSIVIFSVYLFDFTSLFDGSLDFFHAIMLIISSSFYTILISFFPFFHRFNLIREISYYFMGFVLIFYFFGIYISVYFSWFISILFFCFLIYRIHYEQSRRFSY